MERPEALVDRRIVVTGAAGFIGRNLVAELNARGNDNLLLVDNLGCDSKWRNLVGLEFDDILEPTAFLDQLRSGKLSEVGAILHLGACSSTTERDADFLLRNNYQYTRALCEWSLQKDIRFVYASSAATYGDGSSGYSDTSPLMTLQPLNIYGYSKHVLDLWAQKHNYFKRVVGLKYFNVYGPYEDHKDDMRSMINKAYAQIKDTGRVRLFKSCVSSYADGEQMRDFIYVKDAVAVTLHFLEHREIGGLFNCGTGEARNWNDLAKAVFAAMRIAPSIEYIDMPEILRGKYQYFTQAEVSKLRGAGYTAAFTSLEDGVQDYVAFLTGRDGSS
jgi:ADP-L-glycero-D-manno-heptose 6-epimerase